MISRADVFRKTEQANRSPTKRLGTVVLPKLPAARTFFGYHYYDPTQPIEVRLANHILFKMVCTFAIILNTVWIAVSANVDTRSAFQKLNGIDEGERWAMAVPEWMFTIWFTLEIFIRLAAEKWKFFSGSERWWNFVDSFLVMNAYAQQFIPDTTNLSFIRILRVFRLTRVIKVIKSVPMLSRLRTMVFSIMNSFVNLLWALLMIFVIIFFFSIIFQNGVTTYANTANTEEEIESAREMEVHFGNLYRTCIVLLCSVTGGNDWMMYGDIVRKFQPAELYLLIFMFYVCFTMVGLLNVVTGIFVDSAVCTRTEDEVIETWRSEQKNTCETLRTIFVEGDADASGLMSLVEFRAHLQNPWVRAYFAGLEIDPSDAVSIFTLIAKEGSDEVDIDEFVSGVMKLKGHAKSVDVLTLMYDSARQTAQLNSFMAYVEAQTTMLRRGLAGVSERVALSQNLTPKAAKQQGLSVPESSPRVASKRKCHGYQEPQGPVDPTFVDCS
jgi:hypothetical protein